MPLIKTYDGGKVVHEWHTNFSGLAEVVLDDGRTTQICFYPDGRLMVRAWGNEPKKVNNSNQLSLTCHIAHEVEL